MSNNQSNNKPKWWEKTVEYQFILDNHKNINLIAPLAGNEEKVFSDTIISTDSKFILIEFKTDNKSQSSEFCKFNSYKKWEHKDLFIKDSNIPKSKDDAKKEIIDSIKNIQNNNCHFLIYAELPENVKKLNLIYQNYVDYLENNTIFVKTFDDMKGKSVSLKDFNAYLDEFKKLRNITIKKNGEVSTTGSVSFSDILILDTKGNCFTISEFKNEYNKLLQLQLNSILSEINNLSYYYNNPSNTDVNTDINVIFTNLNNVLLELVKHYESIDNLLIAAPDDIELNQYTNYLINVSKFEEYKEKYKEEYKDYLGKIETCIQTHQRIGELLNSLYGKQQLKLKQQIDPKNELKFKM